MGWAPNKRRCILIKRWFVLWFALFFVAIASGCAQQGLSGQPQVQSSSQAADSPQAEKKGISQQLVRQSYDVLNELCAAGALASNWSGTPQSSDQGFSCSGFELLSGNDNGDTVELTLELYGYIYLNPDTMEEGVGTYFERGVALESEELPFSPALAYGKSVVTLLKSDGGLTPAGCAYEGYQHPGRDYLEQKNQELAPLLESSPKLDTAAYDKDLVDYIWRLTLQKRFVASPEGLTQYDLESIEHLELSPGIFNGNTESDPNYRLDASLLEKMPNLHYFSTMLRLKDYSVLQHLQKLEELELYFMDDEAMKTLQVGHTDKLTLFDPELELLDLAQVNTAVLELSSWSTAVGGFKNCDKLQELRVMSTRTDTRLFNADNFPNVTYLNLYFYSDYGRVRDLSQLSTFTNASIDLYLGYQACNDKTVESLQNVKLNELTLDPKNGPYPLNEPTPQLVEQLQAGNMIWAS